MRTAVIAIVVVLAVLVGTIFSLRSNARTGMPSDEVLKRASARARELDAQEKDKLDKDGN